MLSIETTRMCGAILLSVPTIQFGGYYLLRLLSGGKGNECLTPFQKNMFRAGHAHAGVLVLLALIGQLLADYVQLPLVWEWIARITLPVSAIFISGGFFAAAAGKGRTQPNKYIVLLHFGALLLAGGLVVLGTGLLIRQ